MLAETEELKECEVAKMLLKTTTQSLIDLSLSGKLTVTHYSPKGKLGAEKDSARLYASCEEHRRAPTSMCLQAQHLPKEGVAL